MGWTTELQAMWCALLLTLATQALCLASTVANSEGGCASAGPHVRTAQTPIKMDFMTIAQRGLLAARAHLLSQAGYPRPASVTHPSNEGWVDQWINAVVTGRPGFLPGTGRSK